jgi:hypothetical protein
MTTTPIDTKQRLSIGLVFKQTWAPVRANPKLFVGSAIVLGGVPPLIIGLLQIGATPNLALVPVALVVLFANGILGLILQGGLIYAAGRALDGASVTFGECLGVGLRKCLPLLGMALLTIITMELGFILFIVPGVLLALRWCISGPALVLENRGVFGAMGRSAALTKGRRGSIFLLFVLLMIILMVFESVLTPMLFRGIGTSSAQDPAALQALIRNRMSGFYLFVAPIFGIAIGLFWPSFFTAIYHQLRQIREGGAPETLAEVFA